MFNDDGTPFPVTGLGEEQRFTFRFPIPNCPETLNNSTRAAAAGVAPTAARGLTAVTLAALVRARASAAMVDQLQLVFWNETRNDWDSSGVFADAACMAASGDACTFCGYTTHFTTFTLGVVITLNTIDPGKVALRAAGRPAIADGAHRAWRRRLRLRGAASQDTARLADLGTTRGGIMVSVILSVLLFFYLVGLYFVWRVRARRATADAVARMRRT